MSSRRGRSTALVVSSLTLACVVVPVWPVTTTWSASPYALSAVTAAAIFAIVALATAFFYDLTGLPTIAPAGQLAVSAYTGAIVITELDWSFWAALPLAIAVTAAISVPFALISIRTRGLAFLMVTYAINAFLILVLGAWTSFTGGFSGLTVTGTPPLIAGLLEQYYLFLGLLALTIMACALVRRTGFAARARAVRDNEPLARSLGVSSQRTKLVAFVISGAIVGVAGPLLVYQQQAITPGVFESFAVMLPIYLMVILGGSASLMGPVVGAWLVILLPFWLDEVNINDPNTQQLIYGAALIGLVLWAPRGLAVLASDAVRRHWPLGGRRAGADNARLEAAAPTPRRAAPPAPPLAPVPSGDGEPVLSVRGLARSFGAVQALAGIDFDLQRGEIVGLIGPNGSGKTTSLNCISGFLRPSKGTISFEGRDLRGRSPEAIARLGIVRTFQSAECFASMSVRRNCEVARLMTTDGRDQDGRWDTEEILDVCGLLAVAEEPTSSLSHGQMRFLDVALALTCSPKVLLLDEPGAGLSAEERVALAELIRETQRNGASVIVVDHDMGLVLPLCSRLVVLDHGVKIADGSPAEVCAQGDVIAAYLGESFRAPEEDATVAEPRAAGPPIATAVGERTLPTTVEAEREPGAGDGLAVEDLSAGYGRVEILHDVSLTVAPGEIVALLGANGAGKSTLVRAVSGLIDIGAGMVRLGDTTLSELAPHEIVRAGVAMVPEGREIFARQSVRENLLLGGLTRDDRAARMEELLEAFPDLTDKLRRFGCDLSGGQQQMLAIARALMARPRVLLLDEPSLGLAPLVVDRMGELIRGICEREGVGILLVEQNAGLAGATANRALVLRRGRIVTTGPVADVLDSDELVAAYLG